MIFSICLESIYPGVAFEKRIGKVASLGFDHVEFWDWHDKDLEALKEQLTIHNLDVSAFSGHRKSSPVSSEDKSKFLEEIKGSIAVAHDLDCKNLFVVSDEIMPPKDTSIPPVCPARATVISSEEKYLNLFLALQEAVEIAEKEGVTLLLEPLSPLDHPGCFLTHSEPAAQLVKATANPHLKMLFDIYHMQVAEGNITHTIGKYMDLIGYFHFADVPGRHEPGTGELNLEFILRDLGKRGFKGGFGFEYFPFGNDDQALNSTKDFVDRL